jgi:hypothetical protein
MNNLVTLWDPISEKIRNYEILSQCSCWINQHCDSIEIRLSLRSENESVRRDAGYCHHFNHDMTPMFNLSSLSFCYFYSVLFKRVFTHFDNLDYGTSHSSTQRSGTSLSFSCLAIPSGHVRPNRIVYDGRHNSQQRRRACHSRGTVRTRSAIRQHDRYWRIHHLLEIPQKLKQK